MIDIFIRNIKNDPTIKRHLLKSISWRVVGSIDTIVLGWIITGKLASGLKIGAFEIVTKLLLYFIHERIWHRIKFGLLTRVKRAEQVKRENAGNLFAQTMKIGKNEREALNKHKAFTIWLTGLPASGKSSIAKELDVRLYNMGYRSYCLDGDNTRIGINSDLGFSVEDRSENIRRVAEIAKLFNEAGIITIASFISPFERDRILAKQIIGPDNFIETFIDTDIEVCKVRDKKGLYALASQGKLKDFTGVSSPYEKPLSADIHLDSGGMIIEESVDIVMQSLTKMGYLMVP
jgi:adenylyl-sulfate kinase